MSTEATPGLLPIRVVAHHALWDSWVHERDIALPLGAAPPAEPDEVGSSLRYAAALSTALAIGAGPAVYGSFEVEASDPSMVCRLEVGATVTVQDGPAARGAPCLRGDAATLVDALSLRAPFPEPVPPEWSPLIAGLATAFGAGPPIDD